MTRINLIRLTEREFHTVLAALERYNPWNASVAMGVNYEAIASDGGTITPLSQDEITKLAEEMNDGYREYDGEGE